MNLYDLMMKRRSVRNFKDQEIPEPIVDQLLDAANNAPSGGNIQPISVIVIQEAEARKKLSQMVGDQPWVKNAPLSLIFCIDFWRIRKWASLCETEFKGENALPHFLIAYADLMCSAQNVVMLAESHGLGSVYIGTILDAIDGAREYFTIPKSVLPLMVLSIGYPKSIPKNVPKLKREVITHRERYRELSEDEIKKAFEEKYGNFEDNVKKYLERIYVEAVEADKQGKPEWADLESVKKELAKLNIRNNAQFLFRYKYPAEEMVKMNESLIRSFRNAGFEFF
ncbi:MAG: nitroreductase family protein [Candidatus Zixiibacteriota bacterium]